MLPFPAIGKGKRKKIFKNAFDNDLVLNEETKFIFETFLTIFIPAKATRGREHDTLKC